MGVIPHKPDAPPFLVFRVFASYTWSARKKWRRAMSELRERITINPEIRSGKPIFRGTRITVSDVLEYLAGGMSPEEILGDFPDLTIEDIRAALAFAAERERRLFSVP
jgi:uncharacterized protein (DUF433 family)